MLRFANRAIRFDRIRPGDLVWRSSDSNVTQAARPFTEASGPVRRQLVRVHVVAHAGSPLHTEWALVDSPDTRVSVSSAEALVTAQNRAISLESVREQFSRLGNTAYELADVSLEVEGSPFVPVSILNQLRREAVEKLQALQVQPRNNFVRDPFAALAAARLKPPLAGISTYAELHLLVRTPEQLEAAIELAPASITLDYLDLYGLRPSVERVKAAGIAARVASPRVLKPGEVPHLEFSAQPAMPDPGALDGNSARASRTGASVADWRFQFECRQLAICRGVSQAGIAADSHSRSERRAGGRSRARCGSGESGSGRLSAPAGVPHGALRVLPLSLDGTSLQGLRPSVRKAPRGTAGPQRAVRIP